MVTTVSAMPVRLSAMPTRRSVRLVAIAALDGAAAALSLVAAVYLRMNGHVPAQMMSGLIAALPIVTLVSLGVFQLAGLYGRMWSYVSLSDLGYVVKASFLAIIAAVLVQAAAGRIAWMPASVPIIQWFILLVGLGGVRVLRRAVAETTRARARAGRRTAVASGTPVSEGEAPRRVLVAGPLDRVEALLRRLETSGEGSYVAVGILSETPGHRNLRIRGIPILGSADAIDHVVQKLAAAGQRPDSLILVENAGLMAGETSMRRVTSAESLGLSVLRLPDPTGLNGAGTGPARVDKLDLQAIDMADLLGRTQKTLDSALVARTIAGRRVLVTGAGGTIGRELVRQIAALEPAELVLLDAGEFNLYSVDQELAESYPALARKAVLCSIRQRDSVMIAFAVHRPELVFHAAALKHVPLVEENPCAGVQTNVLGTRNVADAAKRFGVLAMVQVSTDKAVNPVGMMGATKRLGELYAQALDLEGRFKPKAPRFLTVRFGNVLGSSGSLIPLFQRQLSRRVSLTVTHPEITRYFMTVNEAVQLILQSTAQALQGNVCRGRIFVLDMGEPVKIIDIARRMIRLAGLEPNRDVAIDIVGLRPGEKLYEELFDESEERLPSVVPGIFEAEPVSVSRAVLDRMFDRLALAASRGDAVMVRSLVADILARGHAVADEAGLRLPPPPPQNAGLVMLLAST